MKNNWVIHHVQDAGMLPGMIDAHTHGLNKYNHLELQFVLAYPPEYVGNILNELGERIKNGEKFNPGDTTRVAVLDCDLKIIKTTDCDGSPILRIIVPDGEMKWPEESNEYPYKLQMETMY